MSDTPIYDNVENPATDPEPSKTPQPKVVLATIGAGVGSAVGEIVTYTIETAANIDIPGNVELAIGVVLTAGFAFLAGYFKKN